MSIPWEVFVLISSIFVGFGAVLWGAIKWFGAKLIRDIEVQFALLGGRLDKINGQVSGTADGLAEHKLYAAENFVNEIRCGERRENCAVRSELLK